VLVYLPGGSAVTFTPIRMSFENALSSLGLPEEMVASPSMPTIALTNHRLELLLVSKQV
jgi:hypothetical protein